MLLLRRAHDPAVVQDRVRALDLWLRATVDVFQFVEVKAVVFLGLPFYLAVRVITGDCGADDFSDVDADAFSMSQAEHFAAARKAHDIPKTINISHLKAPGASPRRPVKR